ncbi:MAG TPA: rRNA maturation RNase YbeY [Candidatus Andersenbacteria bacterium]|nr:rRNA maturation RNase YbeY [Candidatus Andersenbacteria bacterium]
MIADVECENFPLTDSQVHLLLGSSCRNVSQENDGTVAIRCISSSEIQRLNKQYRGKDAPTNILTFSYDQKEHDVALCMDIAVEEAMNRNATIQDYVALLLTHAFLHVLGMDHESSAEEDQKTQMLEKNILQECGFSPISLGE